MPAPPPAASVATAATARLGVVAPDLRPQLAEAARAGQGTHFALVSAAMPGRGDAEALLRTLRAQTRRVAHPSASESEVLHTPQGWRVSWWPFATLQQANNARAVLARQGIELWVVDF